MSSSEAVAKEVKKQTAVILGLDKSGKTSLTCTMQGQDKPTVEHTVGFKVNKDVKCGDAVFDLWDIDGSSKGQFGDWKRYSEDLADLIYCVNAEEPERFDESSAAFTKVSLSMATKLSLALVITHVDKLAAGDVEKTRGLIEKSFCLDSLKKRLTEENVQVFELNATDANAPALADLKSFLGRNKV